MIPYRTERDRGYEWQGSLWSPGYFRSDLGEGDRTTLLASTEGWDTIRALSPEGAFRAELDRRRLLLDAAPPQAQTGPAAELVLAADQFLITPVGRLEDARVQVAGEEIRTVIAGYPWFTDWGRDTMISLEGLTLMTGRRSETGRILRTFAHYVRDGLIPNMFPEGETDAVYHTADATLWLPPSLAWSTPPSPRTTSCASITWADHVPADVVAQFKKETGVDVEITLSNNEEMISKLRATGGAGFDLAQPSQDRIAGRQQGERGEGIRGEVVGNAAEVPRGGEDLTLCQLRFGEIEPCPGQQRVSGGEIERQAPERLLRGAPLAGSVGGHGERPGRLRRARPACRGGARARHHGWRRVVRSQLEH